MSDLRHWHARTTSAASSSTSATRRVAAAEELLPAWPLPAQSLHPPLARTQSLFHLHDASAVGSRTCLEPSETDPPASVASAGQASTMAGSGGGKQACQAHCPADPCFAQMCREHFLPSRSLPSSCHVLHTLLREGAPWFRWLQRCLCLHSGFRTFYMLLGNCRTQAREFVLMVAATVLAT